MVYLNRATCLSAALVVLCVHTASSFQGYSSSGSYSATTYGSPSEYGSYGNYYPDRLYNYGGYVGPNDGRAPIPQPPLKGDPLYPSHDVYPNIPAGNPFPQSGYSPYPKDTPYFPSGQPYPDPQDPGYGQTYPDPQDKPHSGYGQTYPDPQDKPGYGQTYPNPQDKSYPPSGQTYPDPLDKSYPFSGQTYPDPQNKLYSPPGSQYPAPEPYPPKSLQYHVPSSNPDNYASQSVGPYSYQDPKSQVDYKHAPFPAVDPYPAIPVDPKAVPYSPPSNHHVNNPAYQSDPYTNKGYPDRHVQPPHSYRPVSAKPSLPSSLCDNCRFKNGVGYNPFPNSCQAYVTCQKYDGYKLLPTKMSCPYNLFWSQKLLTCVRPKNIECPYDACAKSKGGKTAGVYGNCAAYHVCGGYGRTSAIYCCAYGYSYQANYGYNKPGYQPCVKDHTCSDTCAPQKTPIRKERCRLFPVRGLATKYQELVHGKYVLRWCAPGTAFVHKDCGCTARVKVYAKTGCNAEVFIDFKHGIRDVSGNFVSVGNEWDRVKSVKASGAKDGFAGKFYNGQLILWRFANAPLGAPLKMSFAFLEKPYRGGGGGYRGGKEVLVSNGDCGKPASVSVVFDRSTSTVTAHVVTKKGKPVYVSVPFVPGVYKNILYVHDGKYLTLSVNGKTNSAPAYGDAQVRQCALSLGGVKGSAAFNGLMDDFKLFLCTPKPVPYKSAPHGAGQGQYHAGKNTYTTGPVSFHAGKDIYPAVPGPYHAGKDVYPTGPGSHHAGKDTYPTGPGSHHAGKDTYPAVPGAYHAGKDTYPAVPGPYHAGKEVYPTGPGSHHAGKDTYPTGPGSHHAGKDTYSAVPGPYHAGKDVYPTGPGPYHAGKDTYPTGPGSHHAGKDTYPTGPGSHHAGKDTYPTGPGPHHAGKDTYSTGPGPYHAGKDTYPAGPGPYPAGKNHHVPTPY